LLLLSLLPLLELPLNVECEEVLPQRTGLSDAKNEEVFDDAPEKREREDEELLADGVFLPEEPKLLALFMKS
jgi:hypothetical protein